jgi:hypothetical protein
MNAYRPDLSCGTPLVEIKIGAAKKSQQFPSATDELAAPAFVAILQTQLKRHSLLPDAAVFRRRRDQAITKRIRYSI